MTTVIPLRERRMYPRVSDAIALRFTPADDTVEPLPTHIVQISCGGLRFPHDVKVDTGTQMDLCIFLTSVGETVHINSRVVASGDENNSTFKQLHKPCFVQVEFQNINNNIQQLLESHIDNVINKTGVRNRPLAYSA